MGFNHESYCSSWSCICFSSSVGVVVLTVRVRGGGGALNSEISIIPEGGGKGGGGSVLKINS